VIRSYCTLFDKNYLYQGVALYLSLARFVDDFRLYALCMDRVAFATIGKIGDPRLIAVSVDDLVTPEVARVRERTTHGQFCWVCQPLICQYLLKRYDLEMVTYLESDSMFFANPEPLFEALGARSVSLVPHNYSKGHDYTDMAGVYCVQFNAFRNDKNAADVLAYWRECCFRYDRSAPQVYPGQTTLDEWPLRFPGVAVIAHRGAGVAPWNVMGYELGSSSSGATVNGTPVVFYHYHQYGRLRSGEHELGAYRLSAEAIHLFYRPYVEQLRQAERVVHAADPAFAFRRVYSDTRTLAQLMRSPSRDNLRSYLRVLKRKALGTYNVFPDAHFAKGGQ
jgi:hypothetical protein